MCYKSIINYDLDITNILVVSPHIRYIEVFDIMNPHLTNKFGRSPATSLNRGSTVASRIHFMLSEEKYSNGVKNKTSTLLEHCLAKTCQTSIMLGT